VIEAVYGSAFKETRGVGLPFYLEPYWFVTYFTIFILLFLKLREDFLARKKQNAYQKTWADFPMNQVGCMRCLTSVPIAPYIGNILALTDNVIFFFFAEYHIVTNI